jgi:hypothetical protein
MQTVRLDRVQKAPTNLQDPAKPTAVPGPNAAQAAAYIYDMSSTLRNLAAQQNLTTLALLLEMASVEAASMRTP